LSTTDKYKAVVVGTSAGGFLAVSTLLEKLPQNYSVPIIIVQHRSKEPTNLLEEILQSKCRVKIKQADEKEKIEGGVVYIAPPDYHLLIENDFTFSLSADEPIRFSRPSIDVLLESAASVYKDKLVGIILTGTNNDGVLGIKAIAENGGLVIAQNPKEAQFPTMPLAAIHTKKVDYIFTLSEIQNFLLQLNNN
jgi:two-component system, chemotaxis family, protein-glutamate methylesterase/glutaminase